MDDEGLLEMDEGSDGGDDDEEEEEELLSSSYEGQSHDDEGFDLKNYDYPQLSVHLPAADGATISIDGVPNASSKELLAPVAQNAETASTAIALWFNDVTCDSNGIEIAHAFPSVYELGWTIARGGMRLDFVRELCDGFGPRLTYLELQQCCLMELPRALEKLVNLETLRVRCNYITWINYHLATAMPKLRVLNMCRNWRMPHFISAGDTLAEVREVLRIGCSFDRTFRAKILMFMAMLRKRLGFARDVAELLGKAVWVLRWDYEHEKTLWESKDVPL